MERVNKTLKNLIYQERRLYPDRSWKEIVKNSVTTYNNARIHESTGFTPFEVLRPSIAFSPPASVGAADIQQARLQQALAIRTMHDKVKSNLEKAAERSKKKHAKRNHERLQVFAVGDIVLVHKKKKYLKKGEQQWGCEAEVHKVHRNHCGYTLKWRTQGPAKTDVPNSISKRKFAGSDLKPFKRM